MVYEEEPRKVWLSFFACLLVLFVWVFPPQALKKDKGDLTAIT